MCSVEIGRRPEKEEVQKVAIGRWIDWTDCKNCAHVGFGIRPDMVTSRGCAGLWLAVAVGVAGGSREELKSLAPNGKGGSEQRALQSLLRKSMIEPCIEEMKIRKTPPTTSG